MTVTEIDKKVERSHERESELIFACARTQVNLERLRSLAASLPEPLDWEFICRVAGRNGLLPLVGKNLLNTCSDLLDAKFLSVLSEFLRDHIRNNILQTSKVIEISHLLDSAGIPVLPIKGPTLAIQAYDDISLRHYVDLDMLVQPRHFDRSVTVLQKAGYAPLDKASWLQRKGLFFTRKKDLGLVSEDKQIRIELHWKLSGTHFAMPVEIGELWDRLETVSVAGKDLRALAFNDLFVYLCLHGSRHGWQKLLWICDIHELIRKTEGIGSGIDWFEVRQHARAHGCEKALELGILLIYDLFGRNTDYPEIERILADKTYRKIAEHVRSSSFGIAEPSMEIGDWYAYHLSLKEKMSDRLRMRMVYLGWYLKVAVKPNRLDEAVLSLPSAFYPLYYLIRPVRLTLSKLAPKHP